MKPVDELREKLREAIMNFYDQTGVQVRELELKWMTGSKSDILYSIDLHMESQTSAFGG